MLADYMADLGLKEPESEKEETRNPLTGAGSDVVEVRRLELLTPYMRSKCSTS